MAYSDSGNPLLQDPPDIAALRKKLAKDPEWNYGQVVPMAHNPQTGEYSFAWSDDMRELLHGLLDFGSGMKSGTVTPQATNALMNMPALGSAPEGSLGMFAGWRSQAKDAPKPEMYEFAQRLKDMGAPDREIFDQTGLFQGMDGMWKHEISDSGAQVLPFTPHTTTDPLGGRPLDTFISHPDLFEAYPDLAKLPLHRTPMFSFFLNGAYDDTTQKMYLNPQLLFDEDEMLSVMLHELQHAVQGREGFAQGGNPVAFLPSNFGDVAKQTRNDFKTLFEGDRVQTILEHMLTGTGLEQSIVRKKSDGKIADNIIAYILDPSFERLAMGWDGSKMSKEELEAIRARFLADPQLNRLRELFQTQKDLYSIQRDAGDAYLNLAGEIEARQVQDRWARWNARNDADATRLHKKRSDYPFEEWNLFQSPNGGVPFALMPGDPYPRLDNELIQKLFGPQPTVTGGPVTGNNLLMGAPRK